MEPPLGVHHLARAREGGVIVGFDVRCRLDLDRVVVQGGPAAALFRGGKASMREPGGVFTVI